MYLSLWPNTAQFGEIRGFCQLLPAFSIWCGQKYLSVPTSPQVSCNSWQLLSLVVTHKFAEPAPGLPHYLYFQRITSHTKCKQSHLTLQKISAFISHLLCTQANAFPWSPISPFTDRSFLQPPKSAQAEFLQNPLWLGIVGLCCVSDKCHHFTAALLSSQLPASRLALSFLLWSQYQLHSHIWKWKKGHSQGLFGIFFLLNLTSLTNNSKYLQVDCK